MIANALKSFNWLDICVLIIIFRVIYISIKTGFTVELFKFFGVICSIYLAMHYYIVIADLLKERLALNAGFLEPLIFSIMAAIGYLIFVLLSKAVNNLIKIEAVSTLNKWGGLFLGSLRSLLLASLIVFLLAISGAGYFNKSVKDSFFGPRIIPASVETYAWIWNNVFSKFIESEAINDLALEAKEGVINK